MARIHVLGASGTGTTTLGRALAARLAVPFIDSDTLYWLPTEPPFTTPRTPDDRLSLLIPACPANGSWVFAGSAVKWATPLEPLYTLIVFLRLDPDIRMERIRRREHECYGSRIAASGDMAAINAAFLIWAASYDTAGPEQCSLQAHEQWLGRQTAPVLRLNSAESVEDLVAQTTRAIAEQT